MKLLPNFLDLICKNWLSMFCFIGLLIYVVFDDYAFRNLTKRCENLETCCESFETYRGMSVRGFEDLNRRLTSIEQQLQNRRKSLLVFIYTKDPTIDSCYAEQLTDVIIESSDKFYHIYPMLLVSLMWHESRFDTLAVSHKGAEGIMQIMPKTAHWVVSSYNLPKYDLKSLRDNVLIGCLYFNNLIARHGEFDALSYYNAGRVSRVGQWYAMQVTQHKVEGLELSYD